MPKWKADALIEKKKKEQKAGSKPKSQSSSVENRAKNSTFMGGGSSVRKTEERVKGPSEEKLQQIRNRRASSTTSTPTARRTSTTPQRMTDTGTGSPTKKAARDAQTQKSYGTTTPTLRTKAQAQQERTERRTLAQAQKSGDYDKASELRGQAKPGSRRAAYEQWDKDIAETVKHTLKQTAAADLRVLNTAAQGITLKDRHLYATDEQIRKADQKTAERDKRYAKRIEDEGQAIEDIKSRHGYLGQQALSAVSSATGMATDLATGVPLASMAMRSTGTSMGQVRKKADNLRNKLKATGQYSDDELDEMFRNVDAMDLANAAASGAIEAFTEKIFAGFGPVKGYVGNSSIAQKIGSKLFNKVGGKATGDLLKNAFKGTAEEIAEEEIGGPLQSLAANAIYGNRFQSYSEDAVKRSLADQSNTIRSQVHNEEEARLVAARLSSSEFMEDSIRSYMDAGESREDATELAEMTRAYLTAALSGDVDSMKEYQDAMVKKLAGGENSMKEKFTFQDAIDAAVSTSMMTLATGIPGAVTTMQAGNAFKESAGLNAVKQQAEIIKNWGDKAESNRAQAVIDHIDNGGDISGTQVYEIGQRAAELAQEGKEAERTRDRVASRQMERRDLRISPVNPDGTFAPQTEQRYSQIVDSTVSRYASLARIGESTGFTAEDIEVGADAAAAFETGVISSEQINELAKGDAAVQTVFEDVTGIDLNQFGSYSEMRDALMAKAADNLVNSARLEQVAWNDEARGAIGTQLASRLGANGNLAVQHALNTVDPRDRDKFLLTGEAARRVYEYARNTNDTWDETKSTLNDMFRGVSDVALKFAFNAAKEDKAKAETAYYGNIVSRNSLNTDSVGMAEGKFTNESVRELTGSEVSTLASVSRELGINVIMSDSLDRNENGRYMASQRTIMLNSANTMDDNLEAIFSHEVTHHLAVYAPDEYMKLSRFVMDRWYKEDADAYNAEIQRIQKLYRDAKGQALSPEQALEELIADGSRDFWTDEDFVASIAAEEPSLAKSIINAIKDFLRKLRALIASDTITDEVVRDGLFAEINAYDDAYRLWMNAYDAARKAQANRAIDEWQENANTEARLSIAEDKWSNGEKLSKAKFNSFYSAHKLNYGASQKGDLAETILSIKENGFTSNTALSNVVPASINDYVNPEMPNYTQGLYGARAGDTVMLVPKPYLDQKNDTVKNGFKPRDYEIVTVERDFQPYYELYSKAYDEAQTEAQTRFSLNEPVERVKDLIAVHNLKADDIRNTFDLGGFPMPSIAITKDSMGHDMYGDITLMFHSDTIDPKKRRTNEVFGGDAYTPVFPRIHYKASSKVEKRLSDLYYEWSQKYGYDTVRPFYEYGQTLQDALDRAGGETALIDQLKSDSNLMRMYLRINDNDVEDVMKITEITMPEGEVDLSKRLIDALGEEAIRSIAPEGVTGREALQYRREWVEAHKEQLESAYRDYFTSDGSLSEEDIEAVIPEIKPGEYAVAVRKALDYLRHGATTTKEEKDYEATTNAIKQAAEETGYDEWIDDLFKGVEEKRGLRNDRDMFTPSGNRRNWESLHEPVTLAGVVRVMSQELSAGANGLLGANPKGASQKSYKSLDEIRADEDRLQQLPEEEYKALEEAAVQKLSDVCGDIVDSNRDEFQNRFGAVLDVGEYIAEVLNVTKNRASIQKKLQKDYNTKVSDEQMNDLMEAIDAIANLPTGYFEAKPRRAVGFDEVRAAIIPASMDEDIKHGFNERGIQMYEYDPNVEGDRTQKINDAASENDLRFSISANFDEPYMDAVNSGNMDEAQRLVDEAAERAGYKTVAFHGSRNIFTEFSADTLGTNTGTEVSKRWFFAGDYDTANSYYPVGVMKELMNQYPDRYSQRDIDRMEQRGIAGRLYSLFLKLDNPLEVDVAGYDYAAHRDNADAFMEYVEQAEQEGRDGIILYHVRDNQLHPHEENSTVYMFRDPSQAKSADPVTYAEDGSVIPLSERFDPTNNDIRYSLPTQDSDGNILTDGQMEYFKNSQARDEDGKMQVVYHTTNHGGFTVFDPAYSDDRRSLFFASNWNVSQTYGRNAFDPIDLNNERFNTWEDFVAAANAAFAGYEGWDSSKSFEENAHLQIKDGASKANISIEEWMAMPHDEQINSDYAVEMSLPYLGNPEFDWQEYEFYDSNTMMLELNSVMGKGKTVQRGYYSCYLNLENPLIVDAKGANWNRISYDPYGNETAGITVQDAIEQIESADIADYGIKNIDVEFEYNDDGFPIAVSYDIGLLGIPDEEHWEWTNYVESDSFEPNVEEYTDNGVLDNAELGIAMWTWVEDKLRNYVSDGMIDMMEQTNIDVNGELHYESFNKTGYDFIRGGNIVDVSEFTDNIDEVSGKEYTVNTRDLAEIAENYGHDGVIIRNLMDIGGASSLKGGKALSDIFIAFSSEQVKDTRNENPTENPDIRYSIVDDGEAKSKMAYDDAMDDSYELLAYYEQQISSVNPETFDVRKAFKEEDVVRFLDSLKAEDSVPSDDPVFEADRVRRARSKEDFFNNVNAKWNDRWTTEGEVLKIASVKKAITNLVKGAMANSNSDAQYRNEIVRKTLLDARLAYQLMKQDRTELASYLLYHSAQRMMDGLEFIRDDTAFKEYQGIRDFLRTYRINAPEEFWENEPFMDFRKEYYGRLRIGKGNSNIEDVYKDCQDRWPHLFNEEEREKADLKSKPWDLLQHIGVVADSNVTPFMEAYSSEEATALAFELADQLYEIIANGDRVVSLADSYKERFDAKTKAMKQRHYEAILRERKIREDGIKKERQKFRDYKERQKEKGLHTKHFEGIKKKYDELTKRLLTNTKDKHIPEQYKRELAGLLKAFDFQTVGSKKREERTGYKAQNTIKLEAMRTALENIENKSQLFHINDSVTDIIKDLLGIDEASANKQSIEGKTLDELSASELYKVDKLLGALLHEFNNYEKVRVGVKKQQASDIGHAQNDISLEHVKAFGAGKDYQNTPGWIDKILNLDEVTPAYLFKRIDPNKQGLGLMYGEIRKSFDKYVRNQNQLNEWMEEIVGKYHNKGVLWNKYGSGELTNWRSDNYAQTFNLENGTIRLTIAQMMSVACLANREQAYNHMIGNGVVVAPVTFNAKALSDIKGKANKALPVRLTDADIKTIVAALTPEQRQVANKLQELMATKMADWGNEASMNVIGIKLFEDPNYFPIRSDRAGLTKDLDPNQFEQAIRNFGFTKAVQPGAKNAIMIDDIFDVVTEHCNNMNLYNSYTEAMNDFMKVYNYRESREEGEYTVEQALKTAYSDKAATFIMQFMRDLNGNVSKRASGIEDAYNSLLGNAKKAAVFANMRVAAQQPTAITRAFAVIHPKYLKGVRIGQGDMQEMFDHCPIALWKSWGYYDINMGKSIEDIMMNNGKWLEDKATDLYGALDNVTWTAIWQMVKAEMKDTHPNVKEGTDEYWELCNERMTEIVDLTQVVDSPMHRSHAMRDKGFLKKTATSFMAEPTLTYNMLRDGWISAREAWQSGDKAKARRIAARTIAVGLLQAATVGGMAGIVDALRKKKPDKDDEDERFLHLWWVNFLNNFKDELKVWNKVYFVKDIASIFEGWENSNLALQGIQKFALGWRQVTGDPYARSSAEWYENLADGLGYMFGVPVKTIRTGLANAMGFLGISVSAMDSFTEKLDSIPKEKGKSEIDDAGMAGKLIGIFLSDDSSNTSKITSSTSDSVDQEKQVEEYRETLSDNLTDEQKDKLVKKYEKSLEERDIAEEAASEDFDVQEHINQAQADFDFEMEKRSIKAAENAAGLTGNAKNNALWDVIAEGYTKSVDSGNMATIYRMREEFEKNGGDTDWFDAKIAEKMKSSYKKTLYSSDEIVPGATVRQQRMKDFMTSHGVTEEEISEIVRKSVTARDLKAAMRIGNEEYILDELVPLIRAGLTRADYEYLYKYRNMGANKYDGKYTDPKYTKTTGKFIWPTDGVITSHFGYRNAPTAGASSNHPAIDIGAPQGTAVVAADGGVVISAGANGGYGNSVGIKHDNGMITWYNHLYSWNVKEGDTVAQGQQIAQVGSTGISTGPHLDFKIMDTDGEPVDPEKYLNN